MDIKETAKRIDEFLPLYLPEIDGEHEFINTAMAYSLEDGGKRIRPYLTLAFCSLCGGDTQKAEPFAAAVEYIHTYSLIHDDLPCMDDDDIRRGKPASHIKFGEANALLAGDALLTRAFGILAEADLPPSAIVRAVCALSQYAGSEGMIGGQYLDLCNEKRSCDIEALTQTDRLKTGALMTVACVLGCIAADAEWEKIAAAEEFAESLGIAFQIQDDILDVTADSKELGKPVGSDSKNGKSTYVSLLGLEFASEQVKAYTEKAKSALDIFGESANELKAFADMLINRSK